MMKLAIIKDDEVINMVQVEKQEDVVLHKDWSIGPDIIPGVGVGTKVINGAYDVFKNSREVEVGIKNHNIDHNTGVLIAKGFEFDGNVFSLSVKAQMYWNTLVTLIAAGAITEEADFPYEISTKDDKKYNLQFSDFWAFIATATSTVKGHLATGRDLKAQVNVAPDPNSIIDDRE